MLELWSLFDFLMPGFLGTEKQFQARFGKPILQSRDAKSSSKEQEAGMCGWHVAHKQGICFIVARHTQDVEENIEQLVYNPLYLCT